MSLKSIWMIEGFATPTFRNSIAERTLANSTNMAKSYQISIIFIRKEFMKKLQNIAKKQKNKTWSSYLHHLQFVGFAIIAFSIMFNSKYWINKLKIAKTKMCQNLTDLWLRGFKLWSRGRDDNFSAFDLLNMAHQRASLELVGEYIALLLFHFSWRHVS